MLTPGDWRDLSVSRTMQQREVLRAAWERESERPIMRVLHATLWTLVVFVFGALAWFHFTATPASERHPTTTAEGVGRVVTGEQL